MKACVAHGAMDLRLEDLPDPTPGPGQVVVRVAYGGICGSDLHYYRNGRVGDFTLTEPLVLGHEVSGTVEQVGPGVDAVSAGTQVAVHPATPCRVCPECRDDRRHVCRDTRYLGSAARTPHVQGGFSERLLVPADQVVGLPASLDLRRGALAEPLSVALHAVHRAGEVAGRRVLVTGAGPIGALVVAVLAHRGAAEITVSDLSPKMLAIATQVGATRTVRADDPEAVWPDEVDVVIEASGTAQALATAVPLLVRGGHLVLLGLLPPGGTPILGNVVVTRELVLSGAFRFDHELDEAVALLAGGLPVDPIITATRPLEDLVDAFAEAADRTRASKVLLDLRDERTPAP